MFFSSVSPTILEVNLTTPGSCKKNLLLSKKSTQIEQMLEGIRFSPPLVKFVMNWKNSGNEFEMLPCKNGTSFTIKRSLG
jgi:hypothetical protein